MSEGNEIITLTKPAKIYLIELTYRDEETGAEKRFGLEVIEGQIVGDGDLKPDEAATVFFNHFKDYCASEFMRMAAAKFNGADSQGP
jgi:hypothetical protein